MRNLKHYAFFRSVGEELANKIEDCESPLLTVVYVVNKRSIKF